MPSCPVWIPFFFVFIRATDTRVLPDFLCSFRGYCLTVWWPSDGRRLRPERQQHASSSGTHQTFMHPGWEPFRAIIEMEREGFSIKTHWYWSEAIAWMSDRILLHGQVGPLNCLDHKMLLWTKWKCRAICFTACGPSAVEPHLLKSSRFNVT